MSTGLPRADLALAARQRVSAMARNRGLDLIARPVGSAARPSVPAALRPARRALVLALALLLAALAPAAPASAAPPPVDIHFFWSIGCPHCRDMTETLGRIESGEPGIVLHSYEVTRNPANAALFDRVVEAFGLPPALPVVVIGEAATVGHGRRTESELRRMIADCRVTACPDAVSRYLPRSEAQPPPPRPPPRGAHYCSADARPRERARQAGHAPRPGRRRPPSGAGPPGAKHASAAAAHGSRPRGLAAESRE